jgi:hypothetical protein
MSDDSDSDSDSDDFLIGGLGDDDYAGVEWDSEEEDVTAANSAGASRPAWHMTEVVPHVSWRMTAEALARVQPTNATIVRVRHLFRQMVSVDVLLGVILGDSAGNAEASQARADLVQSKLSVPFQQMLVEQVVFDPVCDGYSPTKVIHQERNPFFFSPCISHFSLLSEICASLPQENFGSFTASFEERVVLTCVVFQVLLEGHNLRIADPLVEALVDGSGIDLNSSPHDMTIELDRNKRYGLA